MRYLILFTCLFLFACSGQTKEELLQDGNRLRDEGNFRGAIVLYKTALEKDANYLDARAGLAEAYLQSGSFDRAEKEFQKLLLQNPSDEEVLLKLAAVFVQKGQPEAALLELDKYHSSNPETSESLTLNGRAHGGAGDLESAENFFKKALLLDATAIPPRLNLAKVYLQKEENTLAKKYLQEIIGLDPAHVAAHYLLATVETRSGNIDEALAVYQNLSKVNPKELHALYMVGLLQMDKGDIEAAQKSVDKILTQFPGRSEGSRLNGLLLYRQDKFEEAILAFSESLKAQQHLLSYFFLGLSHYGTGQFELALNHFQKSLDLNPDFERARILVAMTLLKQKRLDDAAIEIQKVLRKNSNNAYAHNILGSIYLAQGQYDEGMAELETATELDPTLADAHMKRGIFHLSKGDGVQGEADLIKAVNAAPEVMNSRLMLVTHYMRQKNYSAAIEALKAGMDGSATDALLNNYLAAAYFSQEKLEKAIAALNQAKLSNPDYLTPYYNLASYYASKSEYDKAIAEYKTIVARKPDNMKALLGIAALYGVQNNAADVEKTFQQIEAAGTEDALVAVAAYQVKQGQHAAALAVVDRGVNKFVNSVKLLEIKGRLHQQLQQFTEAESAYTRLSRLDPEKGNRLLVGVYIQLKQTEKVEKLVASALKADPHMDYPYLLSAGLLMSQRKITEAVDILHRGIESVKNPLRLQMQLARVYESSEQTQQAEQVYRRITEEVPRFAPAHTALGFLKEKQGEKGEALELYRVALKYDPKNVPALNNAAYLLTDNFGQEKEALDLAMAAYRLKPSDPRVMDTLGYILLKNNRPKDAVNLLEKANELLSDVPTVKLHLAAAKIENGNKADAKSLLSDVVARGNEDEVRQAKALLNTL